MKSVFKYEPRHRQVVAGPKGFTILTPVPCFLIRVDLSALDSDSLAPEIHRENLALQWLVEFKSIQIRKDLPETFILFRHDNLLPGESVHLWGVLFKPTSCAVTKGANRKHDRDFDKDSNDCSQGRSRFWAVQGDGSRHCEFEKVAGSD